VLSNLVSKVCACALVRFVAISTDACVLGPSEVFRGSGSNHDGTRQGRRGHYDSNSGI